jgi:hypothetical protein
LTKSKEDSFGPSGELIQRGFAEDAQNVTVITEENSLERHLYIQLSLELLLNVSA